MRIGGILASVFLLFLCSSIDAQAQITPAIRTTGIQFFNRCERPPRGYEVQVVTMCEIYVAGIADGLHAMGRNCLGPRVTKEGLLAVSLWWIRRNAKFSNATASAQITAAVDYAFPCQARQPVINEAMFELRPVSKYLEGARTMAAML